MSKIASFEKIESSASQPSLGANRAFSKKEEVRE